MLKSIGVSIVAVGLMSAATASAQNFSFEAKRTDITRLGGVGPQGDLYTGAHWSGTYTATFDGEKPQKGTFECAATAQPPSLFRLHTACTMTQEDGSFTSAWGCNPLNKDGSEMSCVGSLHGRSGRFENLRGGASNHVKGAVSDGVGQFFEIGK